MRLMTKMQATLFSAFIWLIGSIQLLSKGLRFLFEDALQQSAQGSLQETSLLFYISLAVAIGFLKGRLVLQKTAKKIFARIRDFDGSLSFFTIYDTKTTLVFLSMILLGVSMHRLPISVFFRGLLDVAIGCALFQGALCFLRLAVLYKKDLSS